MSFGRRSTQVRLLLACGLLVVLLLLLLAGAIPPQRQEVVLSISSTHGPTTTRSPTVGSDTTVAVAQSTPVPTLPVLREQRQRTGADTTGNDRPYRELWLSQEELDQLPTQGSAWQQLMGVASESLPDPDVSDQDDMADVYVLASALAYARTTDSSFRDTVLQGLEEAIDSEGEPQDTGILAVARNVPSYVIAADLINLPAADPDLDESFRRWLLRLRSTVFSGDGGSHTLMSCHETRPNNFGTHCGAARVAIARYLGDDVDLARAALVFRGWLGDRSAYSGFEFGRLTWQGDEEQPVGINAPGARVEGHDVGGALPEEMRRSGQFSWPPQRTGYAWEALQGAIVQAALLDRAGYAAWSWQEKALLRAVQFLHDQDWPAEGDDEWQPWLINAAYDADFPANSPAQPGKNMAWTDWTHANGDGPLQDSNGEENR